MSSASLESSPDLSSQRVNKTWKRALRGALTAQRWRVGNPQQPRSAYQSLRSSEHSTALEARAKVATTEDASGTSADSASDVEESGASDAQASVPVPLHPEETVQGQCAEAATSADASAGASADDNEADEEVLYAQLSKLSPEQAANFAHEVLRAVAEASEVGTALDTQSSSVRHDESEEESKRLSGSG